MKPMPYRSRWLQPESMKSFLNHLAYALKVVGSLTIGWAVTVLALLV
jgi:hypothetical protein